MGIGHIPALGAMYRQGEQCRVTPVSESSHRVSEETSVLRSETVLGTTRAIKVIALVAAALVRGKRHMIMWYDHMITRSPDAPVKGRTSVENTDTWG